MYRHRRIEIMSGAEGDFKSGFPMRGNFQFSGRGLTVVAVRNKGGCCKNSWLCNSPCFNSGIPPLQETA